MIKTLNLQWIDIFTYVELCFVFKDYSNYVIRQ